MTYKCNWKIDNTRNFNNYLAPDKQCDDHVTVRTWLLFLRLLSWSWLLLCVDCLWLMDLCVQSTLFDGWKAMGHKPVSAPLYCHEMYALVSLLLHIASRSFSFLGVRYTYTKGIEFETMLSECFMVLILFQHLWIFIQQM